MSEKRRVDSYQKGMVVHIYSRSTWKDSREAWVIERNPISSKNKQTPYSQGLWWEPANLAEIHAHF